MKIADRIIVTRRTVLALSGSILAIPSIAGGNQGLGPKLRGRVVDAAGNGIGGVRVSAANDGRQLKSATTERQGGQPLPVGGYEFDSPGGTTIQMLFRRGRNGPVDIELKHLSGRDGQQINTVIFGSGRSSTQHVSNHIQAYESLMVNLITNQEMRRALFEEIQYEQIRRVVTEEVPQEFAAIRDAVDQRLAMYLDNRIRSLRELLSMIG